MLDALLGEYVELEQRLADPTIHSDQSLSRKLSRRYAELAPVARTINDLRQAESDREVAKEFAADDESFAAEVVTLASTIEQLNDKLGELLLPRDPYDGYDLLMEIKSGEGGEESALFAGDLLRMYLRYAEKRGWKAEMLGGTDSDLGGFKDVTVSMKAKSVGEAADGVWSRMKFEGGVHRVQRVPVTETQGRIHTSAAGVLVYPDTSDDVVEFEIDEKDIRVDVFRASGKGGQGVNTTDSAVRLTHLPTNTVVSCQNERSQLQNKARAMQVLKVRLQALAEEEAAAKASDARKSQIRTVDRSERIRTYNYPENRINDHRVNYKAHNLDQVLNGDLDPVLDALAAADRADRLAEATATPHQ
jgi:peptide chain release factor 1